MTTTSGGGSTPGVAQGLDPPRMTCQREGCRADAVAWCIVADSHEPVRLCDDHAMMLAIEDPQEVTTGGAPIVRTNVRPQAEHSPPPVVTQPDVEAMARGTQVPPPAASTSAPPGAEAGYREGPVSAPASFRCGRLPHCAIYEAIHVEPPHHGACRVTFHADLVGVYTWTDAAMVVHGLHAGAHLEANRWRWTYPAVEGEEV